MIFKNKVKQEKIKKRINLYNINALILYNINVSKK